MPDHIDPPDQDQEGQHQFQTTQTCPPTEVHNALPMYIGGAALFITGVLMFFFALGIGSDALVLLAIGEMALGIWLFFQAFKTPGARTPH